MRSARSFSVGTLVTLLSMAALLAAYFLYASSYPRHAYLSGWVLFALMLVLTFYNLRKRVPFLCLGSSGFWLRLHICLGIFSGVLFFVHISWSWPSGTFSQILASCYVVVFLSGLFGWWMSRAFPKKLTVAGYETPYERIPHARANIREEAEALVLKGVDGQTSPIIAEFYTSKLGMFFTKPCNWWSHVRSSRSPQAEHVSQFNEVERYVKKGELDLLEKLRDLVAQKHLLDYQYSLQLALRLWLFVHIPLSYSLLVFSVLHIYLVYAFSGAAS